MARAAWAASLVGVFVLWDGARYVPEIVDKRPFSAETHFSYDPRCIDVSYKPNTECGREPQATIARMVWIGQTRDDAMRIRLPAFKPDADIFFSEDDPCWHRHSLDYSSSNRDHCGFRLTLIDEGEADSDRRLVESLKEPDSKTRPVCCNEFIASKTNSFLRQIGLNTGHASEDNSKYGNDDRGSSRNSIWSPPTHGAADPSEQEFQRDVRTGKSFVGTIVVLLGLSIAIYMLLKRLI